MPVRRGASKLVEVKVEEFYYPSKESALKAAKGAVRRRSGMYFGGMGDWRGFNVYLNGKTVQRHIVNAVNLSASDGWK